jgi:3-deoxy-D-manno-octulosonate 8-phosphate phosphatase (KDO 8-P phosphatase)
MNVNVVEDTFRQIGGQFITPPNQIADKLKKIKAFAFDWDGVFNSAIKSTGFPNGFSEADSMGINLLRYDYFYRNKQLPIAAIITGEENPTAFDFARRESFYAIYFKVKNKGEALDHFCKTYKIEPENIAWFFDDVLDLSIAKKCGARFYLGRKSQPLTNKFVFDNQMVDYISGHEGGQNALRECCELILALNGNFETLLNNRLSFAPNYADYFVKRNEIKPLIFTKNGNKIQETN